MLEIQRKSGRRTKTISVGLHNWSGDAYPTKEDIHQCEIIEQGVIHLNSISHVKGEILAHKPLSEDDLKPLLQMEAGYLIDGFENIG